MPSRAVPVESFAIDEPRFLPRNSPPTVLVVSNEAPQVKGVVTASWHDSLPNVADFDVVLLDIVSLGRAIRNRSYRPRKLERPHSKQVGQLIEAHGMVICIVPPVEMIKGGTIPWTSPYWWSPIPLANLLESGTSRVSLDARFSKYFDRGIGTWRSRPVLKSKSKQVGKNISLTFALRGLVTSRSDVAIVGSAYYTVWSRILFGTSAIGSSGPIIVVPEPDRIGVVDGIRILLREVLGVTTETQPPVWIDSYEIHGERELREAIEQLRHQKGELEAVLDERQAELAKMADLKKLLYADGEELESAVWTALEKLGVKVNPSPIPGREDRWFEDQEGRKAIMEIKGHEGSMKRDDARQAEDWASAMFAEKGEIMKGVLFGNPHRKTSPDERPEPWPLEVTEYAKRKRLALVTTSQLFGALLKVTRGESQGKDFFERVLTADGPVKLE